MADATRILIIDDHSVARCGLRLMLSADAQASVVGEADSAAAALALLAREVCDVALLDLNLPDKDGLDLLRQLRDRYPAMAVLVVSANPEDLYAVRALKAGAAGYLTKDCTPDTLVAAVRKVAAGGKYVTPSLLQQLAGMLGTSNSSAPHTMLTDREMTIFRLIAGGASLVSIAATLSLSPSTVTTYRTRILDKMHMRANAELTRYALDHGLLK